MHSFPNHGAAQYAHPASVYSVGVLPYPVIAASSQSALRYYVEHSAESLYTFLNTAFAKGYLSLTDKIAACAFDTKSGYATKLKEFIANTATLDRNFKVEWSGRTYVHYLAMQRDIPRLRAFIASGADVNTRDRNQDTALTLVAGEGMLDMVHVLLSAGAYINAQDAGGMSPLMCAVANGHLPTVLTLLKNCANVHLRDRTGATALSIAAGRCRRDMVEALVAAGANVNTVDNHHISPLSLAIENADAAMISALIHAHADVNSSINGFTVLMLAASRGDGVAVKLLLHAKADANALFDNTSAVMFAERNGHHDVATLLQAAKEGVLPLPPSWTTAALSTGIPFASCLSTASLPAPVPVPVPVSIAALPPAPTLTHTPSPSPILATTHAPILATTHAPVPTSSSTSSSATSTSTSASTSDSTSTFTSDSTSTFTSAPLLTSIDASAATLVSVPTPPLMPLSSPPSEPRSEAVRMSTTAMALPEEVEEEEVEEEVEGEGEEEEDEEEEEEEEEEAEVPMSSSAPLGGVNINAFINACLSGDTTLVRQGLADDLDANIRFKRDVSILHIASAHGHEDVVRALVKAKADVFARDGHGKNALQLAGEKGHVAVVSVLLPYVLQRSLEPQVPENGKKGGLTLPLLIKACRMGKTAVLEAALRVGVSPNTVYGDEAKTFLHYACEYDQMEIVRVLVRAGVDVNIPNAYGVTPLLTAVRHGRVGIVSTLIEAKSSIDVPDTMSGDTALLAAVNVGSEDMVRVLLDANADVNVRNSNRQTALMIALSRGYSKIIAMLLRENIDLFVRDKDGKSVLVYAVDADATQVVTLLLTILARMPDSLRAKEEKGRALINACATGKLAMVRALLAANAAVDAVDYRHDTPLISAIRGGHAEIVAVLLKAKASTSIVNAKGEDALAVAVDEGRLNVCILLLQSKADVNKKNGGGITAVMRAAARGDEEMVQCLVDAKASLSLLDDNEWDALNWALEKNQSTMVHTLTHTHMIQDHVDVAGYTTLARHCKNADVAGVKALIAANVDVNAKDEYGWTALTYAAACGHRKIVRLLLNARAHPIENTKSLQTVLNHELLESTAGASLLHRLYAISPALRIEHYSPANLFHGLVHAGYVDAIRLLIAARADVNEDDVYTGNSEAAGIQTPLLVAMAANNYDLVKLLLASGADIDIRTPQGSTAASLAKSDAKLAALLKEAGANIK